MSFINLDETDLKLINALQKDAKRNIKALADELNMTKSPVYDRIKRLENAGIIEKYVAKINRERVGEGMTVFCFVSLSEQKIEQIEKFKVSVNQIPEVIESYLLGGTNDFMLKVVVKDLNQYHKFSSGKLAVLDNISQIKSTFVLDETKSSSVYPIFN